MGTTTSSGLLAHRDRLTLHLGVSRVRGALVAHHGSSIRDLNGKIRSEGRKALQDRQLPDVDRTHGV